jgi:hypothetical protein
VRLDAAGWIPVMGRLAKNPGAKTMNPVVNLLQTGMILLSKARTMKA